MVGALARAARRMAAADDSPPPFSPPDVTRLRANYAFSVLLPVIFISSIAWVAFLIDPTGLSLRVSTVLTSLLSLLALQFVIEANLPNSSYVLPTKVRRVAAFSVGSRPGPAPTPFPSSPATRPALLCLSGLNRV